MNNTESEYARGRLDVFALLLRLLGSTWLGLALLAAIVGYLTVASTVPALRDWLDTSAAGVYGWWLHVWLWLALCLNMTVATVWRIPLRPSRLGAWMSHAGVLLLACGSVWYVSHRVEGEVVVPRLESGAFPPVDSFSDDRLRAVAVWGFDAEGQGQTIQSPLRRLPNRRAEEGLSLAVATPVEALTARVSAYQPQVMVAHWWEEGGPAPQQAMRIRIRWGQREGTFTFVAGLPGRQAIQAESFTLQYRPDMPAEQIENFIDPNGMELANERDMLIVTIAQGEPALLWQSTGGLRGRFTLPVGEEVEVFSRADERLTITLEQAFERAYLASECMAMPPGHPMSQAQPAVKLELSHGQWSQSIWLGFEPYAGQSEPLAIPTPAGAVELMFTRYRRPLPAQLQVRELEYMAYPGTSRPMDYICRLDVIQPDGSQSGETVHLNEPIVVGPYRISQQGWDMETPATPSYTVLGVASRPGIGLIWAGAILLGLGMPYAFYVKPLLLRRRKEAAA